MTLDQVIQDIQDESDLETSVLAALEAVQQQLRDALSGATLPPAVQDKVDRAFNALEANKAKLAAAVLNTSGPKPTPEPVPSAPEPTPTEPTPEPPAPTP